MTDRVSAASKAALTARMVAWRLTLPLLKRVVSTERLIRLLASQGPRNRHRELEVFLVRLAGRLWRTSPGPCLERSLALYHELGRLGARPELVCGMGRDHAGLVGHAWVVVDERPVFELERSFVDNVLLRFDSTGSRRGPRGTVDLALAGSSEPPGERGARHEGPAPPSGPATKGGTGT